MYIQNKATAAEKCLTCHFFLSYQKKRKGIEDNATTQQRVKLSDITRLETHTYGVLESRVTEQRFKSWSYAGFCNLPDWYDSTPESISTSTPDSLGNSIVLVLTYMF